MLNESCIAKQWEPELYYISGPMSGVEDFNFPLFNRVADEIREDCGPVYNPAENLGGNVSLPRETYLQLDIAGLFAATHLVLLPGWWNSNGATIEFLIARYRNITIMEYDPDDCTLRTMTKAELDQIPRNFGEAWYPPSPNLGKIPTIRNLGCQN